MLERSTTYHSQIVADKDEFIQKFIDDYNALIKIFENKSGLPIINNQIWFFYGDNDNAKEFLNNPDFHEALNSWHKKKIKKFRDKIEEIQAETERSNKIKPGVNLIFPDSLERLRLVGGKLNSKRLRFQTKKGTIIAFDFRDFDFHSSIWDRRMSYEDLLATINKNFPEIIEN